MRRQYSDIMGKRLKGRTAWLVTWDWAGDHAAVPEREVIAAILRPQTSADTVKRIVEILYAAREYHPIDKHAALTRNPYPAQYNTVTVEQRMSDGTVFTQHPPYAGQIVCGHNPLLYARLVDNLRVADLESPDAGLAWDERPPPSIIRLDAPTHGGE
jgi:hypothetical protein